MLLMQVVMLITVTIMFVIGMVMMVLFLANKDKVNKENDKEVVNQRLNLFVSIICLVGALVIGILIPLVG